MARPHGNSFSRSQFSISHAKHARILGRWVGQMRGKTGEERSIGVHPDFKTCGMRTKYLKWRRLRVTATEMKIAIASDHAGFAYKEMIRRLLIHLGHEVRDFGTASETPVDYPVYIRPAAEAVARGECDRGIVLGGSGNGEAIVANKVRGIRCALCWNEQTARWSRQHNDANVLALGQRTIDEATVLQIVRVWLEESFTAGRHLPRVQQIEGDGRP